MSYKSREGLLAASTCPKLQITETTALTSRLKRDLISARFRTINLFASLLSTMTRKRGLFNTTGTWKTNRTWEASLGFRRVGKKTLSKRSPPSWSWELKENLILLLAISSWILDLWKLKRILVRRLLCSLIKLWKQKAYRRKGNASLTLNSQLEWAMALLLSLS